MRHIPLRHENTAGGEHLHQTRTFICHINITRSVQGYSQRRVKSPIGPSPRAAPLGNERTLIVKHFYPLAARIHHINTGSLWIYCDTVRRSKLAIPCSQRTKIYRQCPWVGGAVDRIKYIHLVLEFVCHINITASIQRHSHRLIQRPQTHLSQGRASGREDLYRII